MDICRSVPAVSSMENIQELLLYIDPRPLQRCHSKDGGSAYSIGVGELADNMGQGKISRYNHRLMHRKRVTCELHDSYFRLMTIKHAIPRTAEVTHSDGQLWGDIEWAIELLYNSVKTGSQLVWRPDPLVTRCGRESQHPAEWAPGPPIEQHQENGKETLMAIRVGVNMLQFCSVFNSRSHTTFSNKVRGIFF